MSKATYKKFSTHLLTAFVAFFFAKIAGPTKPFVLDEKINVVQSATFILSLLVSIALFRRIEKQKYSDKLRKDAVLNRLKSSFEKTIALQKRTELARPKLIDLVSDLKKCRMESLDCFHFASAIEIPVPAGERDDFLRNWKLLNTLLTYTLPGSPSKSRASLDVVNGCVLMSPERAVEVQIKLESMKKVLSRIEMGVIVGV